MAKSSSPVNSQMDSKMPGKEGCAHVGGSKPVIKVDIGGKKAMVPTQTAGAETRPSREGTSQFAYGRNST